MRKFRTHGFLVVLILSVMLSGCFGFLIPEPTVTVKGVEDGGVYSDPVTPEITAGKKTKITAVTLTKDGTEVEFEPGNALEELGSYELTVVATAGKKEKVFTYKFTITIVVIEFKNIEEGQVYTELTPDINVTGADSYVIKLSGQEIEAGIPITTIGKHTLEVIAQVGEATVSESVNFILASKLFVHDDTKLDGLGHDKGSEPELNTDPDYIKVGTHSLKFTNQAGAKSCFRWNRQPGEARIWPADWTEYTHWTMWVHIADLTPLSEIELALGSSAGTLSTKWPASELQEGWNFLAVDLKNFAGDNWDALSDMYYDSNNDKKLESFLDIIVRSTDVMTLYFDEVRWYSIAEQTEN